MPPELNAAIEGLDARLTRYPASRYPIQHATAQFHRGRVLIEAGCPGDAEQALRRAVQLFAGLPLEQAKACNLLGVALRLRGTAPRGLAANALGLAHLAAGHVDAAVAALQTAVGAHPRSVRPEAYAMAKANLALAYWQAGDGPRARLVARQVLGTPGSDRAVATQGAAVLERAGAADDDLAIVLDQEPRDRWMPVIREEVIRWADADPAERRRGASRWVGASSPGRTGPRTSPRRGSACCWSCRPGSWRSSCE